MEASLPPPGERDAAGPRSGHRAEDVQLARQHIRELGLYGPVSVEQLARQAGAASKLRLPYADNLVNLIVTEQLDDVTMEQAMRMLAPGARC